MAGKTRGGTSGVRVEGSKKTPILDSVKEDNPQ
jgi:hypothetical protein